MKRITATVCLLALAVFAGPTPAGPVFDLSWFSIDSGGGASSGGSLELRGVIGQFDAGPAATMAGGSYTLTGGFLALPGPTCRADLTGDGVIDVFDLFVLLDNWGADGPGADLAAPNTVVDVFDLFELLGAWGAC